MGMWASAGAKELVRSMVEVDVGERISARGVLRNPWLRKHAPPI